MANGRDMPGRMIANLKTLHTAIKAVKTKRLEEKFLNPERLWAVQGRNYTAADLEQKSCRHCSAAVGTLVHICQKCLASHGMIIRRYNSIVESLCETASKQDFTVYKEVKLSTPAGALNPDVILVKNNKAICWEGGRPFRLLHRQNAEKYEAAVPTVRDVLNVGEVESHGFIIGSRGAGPKQTKRL
ncbi:Retrovirus-related Pol polyprotein from type-1 retrotransposable element [Trichinella spiralis]|uniref:Retrovirus-related Pol polyprotein from type-1 retrotransposable element n=1 Tax=Trichinella spiralis TaxID=6334 RepID=A0ABR3KHV8_TRISP